MHGSHVAGRVVAKISVILVLCIYFGFWYVYHFICKSHLKWAIVFNVAFSVAVWSYLKTCFTDPGTPACPEWKQWQSGRSEQDEKRARDEYENADVAMRRRRRNTYSPGESTWCEKCCRERPERAHHCSMCGVCVLRMDHHCPWIGTCVGFRNHKFFLLMNMWTFLACVTYIVTSSKPSTFDMLDLTSEYQATMGISVVICAVMAIVFALVTGGMFIYGVWLAQNNLTTIEEMNRGKSPYRLHTFCENVIQLVGPFDITMLLPLDPDRSESQCDGTSYPVVCLQESLAVDGSDRPAYGSV